ncbi:MAG TPA: hypothetical protein PLG02_07420 [Methylotenera sp.]|nr:hypothetical protein [Methylotenera sp.]
MKKIKWNSMVIVSLVAIATIACTSQVTKPSIHTHQTSVPKHEPTTATSKSSELKTAEIKPEEITKPVEKKSSLANLSSTSNNPQVSQYLSFADDFSNITAEAQKQVQASTQQALAKTPNDIELRMRLVLIYGLPSSTLLDTAKAQSLLQQLLQESALPSEQLPFANLLFDYIVAANKASKTSREDQKRLETMQQKQEALQTKLENTQQKLEAALQKIDELKNIEKSMGQREVAPKK